jgi:hypothetical protein
LEQLVPSFTHFILKSLTNIYTPLLNSDAAFGDFYSIFFYNTGERHFDRNAGFMWEPSAFAVVLLVALSFNISIKDKIIDKYNIIFFLGIITSFSTTAYLLLPLAISPYIYKRIRRSFFFAIFTMLSLSFISYYYMQSDIIGKKIMGQLENPNYGMDKQYLEYSTYGVSGLSRFSSIVVDYPKLIKNPMLGLGVDLAETNVNSVYKDWGREYRRSNGLMLLFLKFGLVFSFFIFRFWLKGFYVVTGSKVSAILILTLFMALGFSNDLILSPLLFTFISLGFSRIDPFKVEKKLSLSS